MKTKPQADDFLLSKKKLYEKLNDKDFAGEFYERKLKRIGRAVDEILSIGLGWNVITETGNEWVHHILLEIFELFQMRHENFSRSDFAEDLQQSIFKFTMTHDESYRKWAKKSFAALGLDENGVDLEADLGEAKKPKVGKVKGEKLEIQTDSETENLALLLSGVLNNPKLPPDIYKGFKRSIGDLFNNLSSESSQQLADFEHSPEYLARLFKIAEAEDE